MDGTCKKENCPFYKDHGKQCPFYIESWWQEGKDGKSVLVEDCAPIRAMLMQQDTHNRLVGVQEAVESQRNKTNEMNSTFSIVLKQTREYINYKLSEKEKKPPLIERIVNYLELSK